MSVPVVVFDAMGVLYTAGDDVVELLIPYLSELGCVLPAGEIERYYVECSLGHLTTEQFWINAGVPAAGRDEEYTRLHRLTDGVPQALTALQARGTAVACLSNDVVPWSQALRERFGLADRISPWVISGAVGARKPDPVIYHTLIDRLGVPAGDVMFVDDRPKNLVPALDLGIRAVHFAPGGGTTPDGAMPARSMADVVALVDRWT